jgi:uncharacterized protein YycO
MPLIVTLLTFVILSGFGANPDEDSYKPRDGDIIFHTSNSDQSKAVQLATRSAYSHMGIVYIEKGRAKVFEAGKQVQLTPLKEWTSKGLKGHFVVKRLKNTAVLTAAALEKMKAEGTKMDGLNYDPYFEWSDDNIYCSELVWKIYERALGIEIGKLETLKDFDLTHPVVKELVKKRFKGGIPKEQRAISPAAMFKSELLETVFEN